MSGSGKPQHASYKRYAESEMNMALLDPPKWGWPAVGGVVDLLTPQERARRKETKRAFLKEKKRKRGRPNQTQSSSHANNAAALKPPPPSVAAAAAEQQHAHAKAIEDNGGTQKESTENNDKEPQQSSSETNQQTQTQAATETEGASVAQAELKKPPPTTDGGEGAHATNNTNNLQFQGEKESGSGSKEENSGSKTNGETNNTEETATAATLKPPPPPPPQQQQQHPQSSEPIAQQQAHHSDVAAALPREPNSYSKGSNENEKVLEVKPMQKDGGLDVYAYHRGREGMEPRDENTGELLADVPVTDSNWDWDEPKLSAPIKIRFPLMSDDDKKDIPASEIPMFEDNLLWDLGDPETPTPEEFAIDVAENYGLTYGQSVELAQSIQLQIYDFLKENCGYSVPVAMSDGSGVERTHFPPYTYPFLYGDVYQVPGRAPEPGTTCDIARHPSKSKSKSKGYNPVPSASRRAAPSVDDRRSFQLDETDEELESKYIDEVKKRMAEFSREDIELKCQSVYKPPGLIEMKQQYVCHICHKRHEFVGQFACDHNTHAYCKGHLKSRLGLIVKSHTDVAVAEVCPICSVSCSCSKCNRRLEAIALQLKRVCTQQGVEPADAVFEDMFKSSAKPAANSRIVKAGGVAKRRDSVGSTVSEDTRATVEPAPPSKKAKTMRKHSGRWGEGEKLNVPKAPATDFPREVRAGVDVNAGTDIDYRTVFTAGGSYLKEAEAKPTIADAPVVDNPKPENVPLPQEPTEVVEDGNVDYCQKCRKHGNLVCCDYCPRAYHQDCVEEGGNESAGKWECHICCREKQDLEEYKLTGNDSKATMCASYRTLKTQNDDDLKNLSVLSKIHEMVQKLMKYDFGYMFCAPVNCKEVPHYKQMIKKPMDLGTIGKRMVNGYYKKFFEANKSWDDVILAVLKDIELVWHNCFTFNFEGSSINRMAEVHRKRMLKMLDRSINKDLSDNVKKRLSEYVSQCERERGKIRASNGATSVPVADIPPTSRSDWRPVSRHKISIHIKKGGVTKPVAVFDADTGMIVKIYSTMKSAVLAAEFVANLGNKSEFPSVTDNTVVRLVHRSSQDPNATLFGYRWLLLDDLRRGKVLFSKPSDGSREPINNPAHIFEMSDGASTYIFLSIEEALSSPLAPKTASTEGLRKTLIELPEGGEAVAVSGTKWRRLKPALPAEAMEQKEADVPAELSMEKGVTVAAFWRFGKENRPVNDSAYLPPNAIIAKEDVILGRIKVGYDTLDAAFEDWRLACKSSPTVADDEITMQNFHDFYLDGDRNVDGIMWKTIDKGFVPASSSNAVCQPEKQDENTEALEGQKTSATVNPSLALKNGLTEVNADRRNVIENGKSSVLTGPDATRPNGVGSPKNGLKRGRSEDEVLQPRKK